MTDESDKKPKDAEVQQFQQQLRNPVTPEVKRGAAVAAIGGISCVAIVLWLLALAGVGVLVVVGLVIFTCSR